MGVRNKKFPGETAPYFSTADEECQYFFEKMNNYVLKNIKIAEKAGDNRGIILLKFEYSE